MGYWNFLSRKTEPLNRNHKRSIAMKKNEFSFVAPLETIKLKHITTAVFLPHHVTVDLPRGRFRVRGTLNGTPFSKSIQYGKEGSRFFTVSRALREACNIELGDLINISFEVINLEKVDLSLVHESIVVHDSETRKIGRRFSNAGKYDFTTYIDELKKMDVRVRRSIEEVRRATFTAIGAEPDKNSVVKKDLTRNRKRPRKL